MWQFCRKLCLFRLSLKSAMKWLGLWAQSICLFYYDYVPEERNCDCHGLTMCVRKQVTVILASLIICNVPAYCMYVDLSTSGVFGMLHALLVDSFVCM